MKERGHSKMGLASALRLSLDKLPAPNPSRNSWHSLLAPVPPSPVNVGLNCVTTVARDVLQFAAQR
jgi:hypothetical protein